MPKPGLLAFALLLVLPKAIQIGEVRSETPQRIVFEREDNHKLVLTKQPGEKGEIVFMPEIIVGETASRRRSYLGEFMDWLASLAPLVSFTFDI